MAVRRWDGVTTAEQTKYHAIDLDDESRSNHLDNERHIWTRDRMLGPKGKRKRHINKKPPGPRAIEKVLSMVHDSLVEPLTESACPRDTDHYWLHDTISCK